jgi:hypothetical protein
VCKRGEGGVSGQINSCRKVPLRVFRWQHFALPSMSLIFPRVKPIAAVPAGGASPTTGEQQPFIRVFKPNCLTQEAHQWEQSSAGSTWGEGAQDVAWRSSLRVLGPQDYTVRQGQRENVWEVWVAYCPQQDEEEVLLESLADLLFDFTKSKNMRPFFVLICTFFSNFLGPEAFRDPSCFFKTQKVFDIIPLVP